MESVSSQSTTTRTGRLKTWSHSATQLALRQAQESPGSLLRAQDLTGTTPTAAAKALARLADKGFLTRVGKGLYYAPRETLLGPSRPSEMSVALHALRGKSRPTGASAANLLGLSTQLPARPQLVAFTSVVPKGAEAAHVKLRAQRSSALLDPKKSALLEFLRDRGIHSEYGPDATFERLKSILLAWGKAQTGCELLVSAALTEPPRVRAILGALMEWVGLSESLWMPLRDSLNRLSRFDFGLFAALPNAKDWLAK
jgi:Family of unknown function (DUF6088)